LSTLILVSKPS